MDPAQQQMQANQQQQAMVDAGHLRLLSIFHYVWGGMCVLGGIFMICYIFIMKSLLQSATAAGGSAPPAEFDQMMSFIGILYAIFGVLYIIVAILNFVCGKLLSSRKSRTFIMIVAGINCLGIPLGTTLGVFTFIVLLRPSVRAVFDTDQPH